MYEEGQRHRAPQDGAYEDKAYENAAHNDKAQGGNQADKAQEVVQEVEAHKDRIEVCTRMTDRVSSTEAPGDD